MSFTASLLVTVPAFTHSSVAVKAVRAPASTLTVSRPVSAAASVQSAAPWKGSISISARPSKSQYRLRRFAVSASSEPLRHKILADEKDPPKVEVISPEAAYKLMGEGWTYLDVRTPEEYVNGHAPGAVNVPFLLRGADGSMSPNPDFLQQAKAAFPDADAKLIVACQLGKRATFAANALDGSGYTNLKDIQDGFSRWVTVPGLPVEK